MPKSETCQFFGCPRPQLQGATYNTSADMPELTPPKTINICSYHEMVIVDSAVSYNVGLTFRGELEIRPVPKP